MKKTETSRQYAPLNAAKEASDAYRKKSDAFAKDYMGFLQNAKTERDAVAETEKLLKKAGYRAYQFGDKLKVGDKIYYINRNHAILAANICGDLSEGVNLACAHLDSPRIDLKPNPLYEDAGMAFFRTHYYGGLKKYQWPTIPLSLHGVIYKANGEKVDVCIGEKDTDPVFCISDLLPHLDHYREKQTLDDSFKGEMLNCVIGSIPQKDTEKDAISEAVLGFLEKTYGVTAKDLVSAELTLVPAGKPREIGFDRSMIGAYGHDDKVCAYPSLRALLDGKLKKTAVIVFADKEEIGSDGVTGLNTNYLYDFLCEIADAAKVNVRKMLSNSLCLSADVAGCFDPTYPEAFEKRNAAHLNCGVAVCKYTGHGGKYSTSDAPAEVVSKFRKIFDDKKVFWQIAELGKVDNGGGGTLAKYVAKLNIGVLDAGVPVLSMHAPFEIVSKLDVYAMYDAALAFFEA